MLPEQAPTGNSIVLHASTVAVDGRAAVIRGSSGRGKSGLALQLMALGAGLVADDRTILLRDESGIRAQCPPTISGQIEARGVGILATPPAPVARVALVVDMDNPETERLPPMRTTNVLGMLLPVMGRIDAPYFPAAILLYLRGERIA